jgi:hypothetical protein
MTGKNVPNYHKIYQMAVIYIPTGRKIFQIFHKIYQHLPFQGPPKYIRIRILVQKYTIWHHWLVENFLKGVQEFFIVAKLSRVGCLSVVVGRSVLSK